MTNITLGIEYVVKYGGWNTPVLDKVTLLAGQLNFFAAKLRSVRNKVLSHNDLSAILSEAVLGTFDPNEDDAYFQLLQEFVDVVHAETIGGPFPFDSLAKNDAVALLSIIKP